MWRTTVLSPWVAEHTLLRAARGKAASVRGHAKWWYRQRYIFHMSIFVLQICNNMQLGLLCTLKRHDCLLFWWKQISNFPLSLAKYLHLILPKEEFLSPIKKKLYEKLAEYHQKCSCGLPLYLLKGALGAG